MTTSKACIRYAMSLLIALSGSSAHAASTLQTKTPEEVADLYLDAWVRLDEAKAQALSRYLHEKDARDQNEIFSVIDAMRHPDYEDEARNAFPDVSETTQRRMASIMQVTSEAVQRSECHALNHTVRPNIYAEGQEIYTVNVTCKAVSIPASISNLNIKALAKMTMDQVSTIINIVKNAPLNRVVNVTFDLYSVDPLPGDTNRRLVVGYAGFSEDVLDKIM